MAWIESHQSLRIHPKTLALVAELHGDRHKLLGHLHCLWWWALEVADLDGHLPANTSPAVIAAAAEWPISKAGVFVNALVSAGFLDLSADGYSLHDWWDYAGKLNAKRAANKDRMRATRATHVQRTEQVGATHVQGLPTNQPNQPTKAAEPSAKARPSRGCYCLLSSALDGFCRLWRSS